MTEMIQCARDSQMPRAAEIQTKLAALHRALFAESSPIPVKAALALLGRYGPDMRLPLTPMSDAKRPLLESAMKELGLIGG